MRRSFVVDGSGDGSSPSSGFGEFDGGDSLHPKRGFASVQLGHRGVKVCMLVVVLSCPLLGVVLPGAGSRLLLYLVSLLLIGEELHS
jgi:hypothetical protein